MSTGIVDRRDAYDVGGVVRFMAQSGGYIMCQRPRAIPIVLSEKDWRKLPKEPLPQGSTGPAIHSGRVLAQHPTRSPDHA